MPWGQVRRVAVAPDAPVALVPVVFGAICVDAAAQPARLSYQHHPAQLDERRRVILSSC
jgi:hypothetical protein